MTEISPLLIYFIGQLDAFNGVCALTLFLGGISLVVMNIIKAASFCDSSTYYELKIYNKVKLVTDKTNKVIGPIVFAAFLGVAFLPSRSTVAAMIVVPAIVNNENIQNISKNTLQWAEEYIKDQLQTKKKND
jgi:hypothetical protein